MRKIMFAAAIGLLTLSGAAVAGTRQATHLRLPGYRAAANRGAVCDRTLNSSADDFCSCPANTDKVRIEVCQPGQVPPSQSGEYERFAHRASADGSLIGDDYNDQPVCARDTRYGRSSRR